MVIVKNCQEVNNLILDALRRVDAKKRKEVCFLLGRLTISGVTSADKLLRLEVCRLLEGFLCDEYGVIVLDDIQLENYRFKRKEKEKTKYIVGGELVSILLKT